MAEQSKNSCRQPTEVKGERSMLVFVHLSLTNQAPYTHKEIIWNNPPFSTNWSLAVISGVVASSIRTIKFSCVSIILDLQQTTPRLQREHYRDVTSLCLQVYFPRQLEKFFPCHCLSCYTGLYKYDIYLEMNQEIGFEFVTAQVLVYDYSNSPMKDLI